MTGNGLFCWECRDRRLVCDSTQPSCKKCLKAGRVCSGYGKQKPVKFFEPGTIVSRRGKRQTKARVDNLQPTALRAGSSDEDLPETGKDSHLEIAKAVEIRSKSIPDAPLRIDVRRLRTDVCEIGEAIHYYNSWICTLSGRYSLSDNPWAAPIMITDFSPTPILHGIMVYLYSIYRQLETPNSERDRALTRRRYRHKGEALQGLQKDIENAERRVSDATTGTMILMLVCELQQEIHPVWRPHAQAILSIIELKGGFRSEVYNMPFRAGYISFFSVAILADTMSPPFTHLNPIPLADLDAFDELLSTGDLPSFPAPPVLTKIIIKTTYLRDGVSLGDTPWDLLAEAQSFVPKEYADTKDEVCRKEFLLLANLFQSSVILYIISSLYNPATIDKDASLLSTRLAHRETLFSALEKAAEHQRTWHCVMWSLVIAGFEATEDRQARRDFVTEKLKKLRAVMGYAIQEVALRALENFWLSGGRSWDQCFDHPRALHI